MGDNYVNDVQEFFTKLSSAAGQWMSYANNLLATTEDPKTYHEYYGHILKAASVLDCAASDTELTDYIKKNSPQSKAATVIAEESSISNIKLTCPSQVSSILTSAADTLLAAREKAPESASSALTSLVKKFQESANNLYAVALLHGWVENTQRSGLSAA